jgi:predicted small lipoprotein YifL
MRNTILVIACILLVVCLSGCHLMGGMEMPY